MAQKPKDKFFKSRMKQREAFGADAAELRDVESLYTNMLSILKEMGTANQKRLDQLKQEGNLYKQTKKLANEVFNTNFQRQDLEDKILEAIVKGNHEEAQRLKTADLLNDKYERQNKLVNKQVSLAGDLGRKIEGIFNKIPGGGLLASMLGLEGLGEAIEKEVRIRITEGGGLRGALGQEGLGGLIGQSLGKAGQGTAEGFTEFEGKGIFEKSKILGQKKGNVNAFLRSLTGMQLFGGLATVAAVAGAGVLLTRNLRAGMEKGMGLTGTGRPFMQQMFFGDTADAFEDEFGKVDSMAKGVGVRMAIMSRTMGLSAENAAALTKELVISSDLTQEQSLDVLETVQGLAKASGVAPKAIFEDMAQNSDLFAQFAQDGAGGLAEAAIKAKTLGLNLSAVSSVAKSLLDFETSISNEFEAQVLTGKMINLDRARGLALQGKASELLDEIVKQVGGEAELRSMNILQMESLAAAVGLSVSQLQRVVQGNEAALKNPVVSKLDETNEILRAQLDTEQRQLLGQQKQDTLVTYG
jgi:hypothetical protein